LSGVEHFCHQRINKLQALVIMMKPTTTYSLLILLITPASWVSPFSVNAFSTVRLQQQNIERTVSSLLAVIRPESVDFDFDVGQGGVRLAQESVVKITGTVTHKPGNAEPKISNLIRYKQIQTIKSDQIVVNALQQIGGTIIAAGRGNELYKDPGTTTEQVILYAPIEAVKDSLIGAKSAMQSSNLVINFCSGDDAQVLEVLSAIKKMVLDLDIATKTKISFNSISHMTFPMGTSAVTVIAVPEAVENMGVDNKNDTVDSNIMQSILSGEIYFRDGVFYTLIDDDINPAIA
jgi:hypothetical protein